MDEGVKYYIEQARRSGYDDSEVKHALLSAGWKSEFVDLLLGDMPGTVDDSANQEQKNATLKSWIKGYYRIYIPQIITLSFIGILIVIVLLLEPWAVKVLIDSVFDNIPAPGSLSSYTGTITLLTIVAFLLLGAYILENGLKLLLANLSSRYNYDFDRALKAQFFGHILRLPSKYRSKLENDKYFVNQMTEVSSDLTKIIIELPVVILNVGLGFIAALFIMFTINIPLTIMSLLIIPALYGVNKMFVPKANSAKIELDTQKNEIQKHVEESVRNIKIIQTYSKQDNHTNRFLQLLDVRFHSVVNSIYVEQGLTFVRGLVVIIGVFTIVYVGGRQILLDNMTLGELFIIVFYINRFYGPLEIFTKGYDEFKRANTRIQKFYDVLIVRPDVDEQDSTGKNISTLTKDIIFDHVQVNRGDKPIIKDVNISLKAGSKIGIMGPDGSGKSTFIELLQLHSEYSAGSIKIDGIELKDINTISFRNLVTVVSSEPQLFSDTILNNILYAVDRNNRKVSSTDVVNAVSSAGATEFIEGLPNNYETNLADASQFLTPTQKVQIELARAFLRNSQIILIDEPTGALDALEEKEVLRDIFKLINGKTVLMASNKLSLLTQMDAVYAIEGGAVIDVNKYGGIDRYLSYLRTHELI